LGRLHGVRRLPDGGLRVRLSTRERDALRALATQIAGVLTGEHELAGDGSELRARLFPPAYADDPLADLEFRELVGGSIAEQRSESLDTFLRTLDEGLARRLLWTVDLDPDESAAWLSAVNDSRLTLATIVGIESESQWEDGPDPSDQASVMLYYLGWLEEQLVTAMMASLPDDGYG
jgi:hypothetical protein